MNLISQHCYLSGYGHKYCQGNQSPFIMVKRLRLDSVSLE